MRLSLSEQTNQGCCSFRDNRHALSKRETALLSLSALQLSLELSLERRGERRVRSACERSGRGALKSTAQTAAGSKTTN
jgi:hypothetical protein